MFFAPLGEALCDKVISIVRYLSHTARKEYVFNDVIFAYISTDGK